MKQSSKTLLGLAVLLALALAAFLIWNQKPPSDREQILAQLEAARAAAEAHSAGGIMQIVSADYHDPLFNNDRLALFLRKTVNSKNSEAVRVALTPPNVQAQGETATTTSHLTVVSTATNQTQYEGDVTLHWKREDGHRLLVFPAKVWRVVSADYNMGGLGE